MKAIRWTAVLLLAANFATTANAKTLCPSDSELRNVLVDIMLRSSGATVGTCIRKYPELSKDAVAIANQFASKYDNDMKENRRVTTEIFNRRGNGIEQKEAIYKAAAKAAIVKAEQFSLSDCRKAVLGLQAMSDLNSFSRVKLAAQTSFAIERSHVPQCAE